MCAWLTNLPRRNEVDLFTTCNDLECLAAADDHTRTQNVLQTEPTAYQSERCMLHFHRPTYLRVSSAPTGWHTQRLQHTAPRGKRGPSSVAAESEDMKNSWHTRCASRDTLPEKPRSPQQHTSRHVHAASRQVTQRPSNVCSQASHHSSFLHRGMYKQELHPSWRIG
jgi:hypothetical protein